MYVYDPDGLYWLHLYFERIFDSLYVVLLHQNIFENTR